MINTWKSIESLRVNLKTIKSNNDVDLTTLFAVSMGSLHFQISLDNWYYSTQNIKEPFEAFFLFRNGTYRYQSFPSQRYPRYSWLSIFIDIWLNCLKSIIGIHSIKCLTPSNSSNGYLKTELYLIIGHFPENTPSVPSSNDAQFPIASHIALQPQYKLGFLLQYPSDISLIWAPSQHQDAPIGHRLLVQPKGYINFVLYVPNRVYNDKFSLFEDIAVICKIFCVYFFDQRRRRHIGLRLRFQQR